MPLPHFLPNCGTMHIFKRVDPYAWFFFVTDYCISAKSLSINSHKSQGVIKSHFESEHKLLVGKKALTYLILCFTCKLYDRNVTIFIMGLGYFELSLNFVNILDDKFLISYV